MANCISKHLTSTITDNTMEESESFRFTLTQTHALYVSQFTELDEVEYCVERIIICSVDCGDVETRVEFPACGCISILPAGTYEITLPEQFIVITSGELGVNILLEPVDAPYINAIIANNC